MVELDPIKLELNSYDQPLVEMRDSLDLAVKEKRIQELNREMEDPHFWDNPDEATKKQRLLGNLKNDVETYNKLVSDHDDIRDMIEMADEEPDPSIVPEVEEMFEDFKNKFETLRMKTLLSGEYDDCNAIVTLHAGTGGTEAMDWTSMLYRMYSRWAESHGFQVEVLDSLDGDEAGLKSITFQVNGENAYGLLKSEHGVHRLVRISPFNANGKRQTSFSACEVMPDIEEDLDIEIDPKDIRIDTYRSSGAGGQHINKTSSAIRITHFPTGIVVTCQNERSQFQNKDKAFQELKIKLFMLKQQENAEKLDDIRGKVTDIAWGNQIRSYFLQPYQLIKDLRTGEEQTNAQKVLDGGIDPFINAYLKWIALGNKDQKDKTEAR
ncbi:MAG: peptide chain release factor 2 [Eubacteriales bacterium]|nr:peptide chain release factor 2 [Lachnospiraceae bacterium]MDD5860491.1 peptide chain release factor 2 [Eubacteriales bacterium]MCH4063347.1 peptide chain release factor 2 [Lachnospiraceae bacterium]MCH4104498.1 peptide chain release factor 2 [Lachnospiraceae bacterium]MCI1309221.1 peptide chain release factor 2 [Lachnospiraceae bacterium]